jgi:hypothetical protein
MNGNRRNQPINLFLNVDALKQVTNLWDVANSLKSSESLSSPEAAFDKPNHEIQSTKKLTPIDESGRSRTGSIATSFKHLLELFGPPNVEDDPDKVEASWGFQDEEGRKGFIWCYNVSAEACINWSCDGDSSLLNELFGSQFKKE